MSSSERPTSSSSSSSSTTTTVIVREMDPLLKDLDDKKKSFRRNVALMASELKDVRQRLACQQQCFVRETLTREEAEAKAKKLEQEINGLQKSLDERNEQLQASASNSEKHLNELDDLRLQLRSTQASAEASAISAQSAQIQCSALLKELDEKNLSLKEHETRVNMLAERLNVLQKDLQLREISQKQLKDEVVRVEHDIMQALAKAGVNKDSELRKILDEVSPRNIEMMNKLLSSKDEEICKLRDEIRIMSAHWKFKIKELESQLEKQRRVDQELKKKVLKLEFCLHDARSQTRKLQRMGQRRDKALKELTEQLATLNQQTGSENKESKAFFETSGFKIVVSMSMLVLVLFSKR